MPTGTNPTANAIRRAQREAQRQMASYLDDVEDQLAQFYRNAGALLQGEIAAAGSGDGSIPASELRRLRMIIDEVMDDLRGRTEGLLDQSIRDMINLGMRPFAGEELGAGVSEMADEVLRNLRAFTDSNGLQLSDRIWRVDTGARREIQEILERAVSEGLSASEAARDYMTRGLDIPSDIVDKRERSAARWIALEARNQMDGGVRYRQALQVMRTETVRAHGMAHRAAAQAHPDVIGVQFTLSPAHPKVDICDIHAQANIYGLGPGVYPPDRSPWPAHPNTMSYEQVVFKDEITDEDREGKQTRVDWLSDQPDRIALPALGGSKPKLRAFREGLVGERSIATPWRTLRKRLEQKGINPARFE